MAKTVIHLAPVQLMREMYFGKDQAQMARDNFASYKATPAIEMEQTGEDAAEEAFDLTNNPSRQEEREQVYGRGRSLSVGDVVESGKDKFVCLSFGWEKM